MVEDRSNWNNGKIANIERLRILAAFGIVWFHTMNAPFRSVGYAGLPIFLLIFISLIVRYSDSHDFIGFVKRRASRLLLPWLFWSAIYGLCILGNNILTDKSVLNVFVTNNLLIGTSIHLWYLPYAFGIALCLYFINKFISKISGLIVVLITLFLSAVTLYISSIVMSYNLVVPLPQWLFGLASLPLGIAIGRCSYLTNTKTGIMLLMMIVFITLIACLLLMRMDYPYLVLPYGIGTTLVCIAYLWHGQYGRFTAGMASLTYGIYLIHPLVGYFVKFIDVFRQFTYLSIIGTFFISALLIFVMKKSVLRRFI